MPFIKNGFIILFLFSTQIIQLNAQVDKDLEDQAALLYSFEEYEMARLLYDSLHNLDPYNPDYSAKIGDCYINTSETDIALKYYNRSLSLSSDPVDLYFKIANAYDLKNMSDSAIYYFNKYNLLSPDEKKALNRVAILYLDQETGKDSALFYAQRAIAVKPEDPDGYYTLSMIYLSLSRFEDAIYTASSGLKSDSEYGLLYMPIGLGYYNQEDFQKAVDYFEKGWKVAGLEEIFVDYLAFSKLLLNTSANKIHRVNEEIRFNDINQKGFNNILELAADPNSVYNYPTLIRSFKTNFRDFGLDDYAMLYYGFSLDESFLPNEDHSSKTNELWDSKNYTLLKANLESRLDSVPVDFPIYWPLSKIAAAQGDYKSQLDNLIKYYGFSQAIKASGDGSSIESPFIITYFQHEYEIINQLELDIVEEYLETSKNNYYDIIRGKDSSGLTKKVYFNVNMPYSFHTKNQKFSKKKKR